MHAPTPPTLRQAPRRHAAARAALFALLGLLAAACGGSDGSGGTKGAAAESQEVHLQPVASAGPDPFTSSSATQESAPVQPPLPNPTGQGIRTVNAATPGLYGGTQRLGSCDVEQQVRFLTEDNAKAGAFAQASGIEQEKIPEFLRGLTPVVLRADARVTSHGFSDGRASSFQSVLQAGTAVLVDGHGVPRVRCACGNPLLAPRAAKGAPVYKGDPWNGYQPNQVVVIEPTAQVINNLVIVNIANNTWLERKIGDDGAQDRTPRVLPPYDPADGIPPGAATEPGTSTADPCGSTTPPVPDGNGLTRPDSGAAVPSPAATDCASSPPTTPPSAPNVPNTPNTPDAPAAPPTSPPQPPPPPPSDVPSDLPGAVPPGNPSDIPSDVPPGNPSDIPSDLPPQSPSDPGMPPAPDGSTSQPADPFGPYDPFDPFAPSQDPAASDPGVYLESA
ncbi:MULTISPECIES: DUF6777 domain-containing protein [unclassified Streptomyces]|uniref:DUF6777 domain-containing protein n=1 Tax=unclassified Streptomyces TaxID=2593676 RepID=UPI001BECDC4F|nr:MULTISPECIES: DUF6777 domain-containing protein [unclassified Streptomyces]MBT2403084.1 hypothetical protein [Streptomyces sp. ISL-21]MBT2459647.1 hypothetical protein [Streptomyces sp. ISL-86]MBT2610239.1 hypothetical protein [Streptomyces sp. ISL-87]